MGYVQMAETRVQKKYQGGQRDATGISHVRLGGEHIICISPITDQAVNPHILVALSFLPLITTNITKKQVCSNEATIIFITHVIELDMGSTAADTATTSSSSQYIYRTTTTKTTTATSINQQLTS